MLVPFGLLAALSGLSGLWMTVFYPRPENVGDLLTAFRLVLGTAVTGYLVLGYVAIRRRAVSGHRAWLTRAYAIGLGAGIMQAVFIGAWTAAAGQPAERLLALLHAAWLFSLTAAEWIIRTHGVRATPRRPA